MSSTEVTVVLSDCDEDDARVVLSTLEETFTPERAVAARGAAPARPGGATTVWASVFDVGHPRERAAAAGPVTLEHPVSVEAQGGYQAVDRLLAELGTVFEIEAAGTAAGDQEKDVHLRIRGR
ncbi:hypothetical protein [Streptomyces sp. NRRL S-87]|uniref:hypothetical protein n=1 Tax=Streptomyces sp. NRRL S-87 TaxID=1463920 RepID=UPI000A5346FC|nr:hypothetical protein [Streptomyces sp. NRRL S-87]